MATHRELKVWQNSMNLAFDIYKLLEKYPKEEKYVISNQMQRCAISIPSNIAEGAARNTVKDYIRFLYISLGSLSELETLLIISVDLNYIDRSDKVFYNLRKIRMQLCKFISHMKNKKELRY